VHVVHRRKSENAMKKTTRKSRADELRDEYDFDYAAAKPNRFAARLKETHTVVLDPDVAAVFTSAKAVNNLLRSAIVATGNAKAASKKATPSRSRRRAA
jgi:hypothetical protein